MLGFKTFSRPNWIIKAAGQEPITTARRKEDGPFISPEELKSAKDHFSLGLHKPSRKESMEYELKQGGLLSQAINHHKYARPATARSGQSKRSGPLLDFS